MGNAVVHPQFYHFRVHHEELDLIRAGLKEQAHDDGVDADRFARTGGSITIGSAYPYEDEQPMEIKGRNLVDGLPKNIQIHPDEVREALVEPLSNVLDAIRTTLERTPPELSADIIDHGIVLTGGGALLKGLDRLIDRSPASAIWEPMCPAGRDPIRRSVCRDGPQKGARYPPGGIYPGGG